MDQEIAEVSERLVAAVHTVYDHHSSQQIRVEAHKVIEEFKEHSLNCAGCGFYMFEHKDPLIRHFALKLIDNHIKIRWNECNPQEKLRIKDGTLNILSCGLKSVMMEENYIKDALSQIVVEIIKREWPQQWPSLLSELNSLCGIDEIQREIVLMILLRLAEDIVQFQSLPDQRRKEIHRTLCSNLNELMDFFIRMLNEEYNKYCSAKHRDALSEQTRTHCHVVQVTLETLFAYLDWVPVIHISENISLFYQLCALLSDENLQFGAAKCLLQLVERKGKIEDRKPLLELFNENAMSSMFNALSSSDRLNEKYYFFLKQLCQVLTTLGNQLGIMWGSVVTSEPSTFKTYLNCILAFTKHPSMVISQYAQNLWLSFLRQSNISKLASIQQVFPELLKIEADKLMKVGFPSQSDSIISEYSRFEFDADEQYGNQFYRFRADVVEIIKLISSHQPEFAFKLGSQLLLNHCNSTTLSKESKEYHLVWEMLSFYLEAVCGTISKKILNNELPNIVEEGLKLLQLTINFNSESPLVLSTSMSCMSALLVFVSSSPNTLPAILDKLFSVICRNHYGVDNANYKELKNLRRHACCLLVNICSSYTTILVVAFDQICHKVKELVDTPKLLTIMEKSMLMEALMILSNDFYDYQKQLLFLKDVLSPITTIWSLDSVKMGISNADNLLSYFGLNQSSEDPAVMEAILSNKRNVMFCIDVMKGCVKRCKWPEDTEVAKKCGFTHPSSNMDRIFFRNPLSESFTPLLNGVFVLIRSLHLLHEPLNQAKIHSCFSGILEITDTDRNSILGLPYTQETSQLSKIHTTSGKTKYLLNSLYDACLHIIGKSTVCLGFDYYSCPGLANAINEHVMCGIEFIPDFKLKCLIRSFMKLFVTNAPSFFYEDLIKVLSVLCPFMYQKLSTRWVNFKLRYGTSVKYEDQMTELQEVLEDQLNRQLTREYISFIGCLLHKKVGNDQLDDTMDDDADQNSSSGNQVLSELGIKVLQSEGVRASIVCTVYDALHWLDTVSALGSLRSCESILKQFVSSQLICHPSEANYLMLSVIYGLQELGEHEANQSALLGLGAKIYESLRPQFPCLNDILLQHTSCVERDINTFEEQLHLKNIRDRRKRDLFRNICAKIIGKNIGQHHKHNIRIEDLPPLFMPPHPKNLPLEETIKEDVGLCKFFTVPDAGVEG